MPAVSAKRLPPAARREQLEAAALAVAAKGGYTGTTLDAVAERAGVTRNLLYHYFPRGQLDVFLAAVDLAGRQLTGHWNTDSDIPLDERLAANFAGIFEHALEPTDAWLVHRQARVPGEPEIDAVDERYRALVLASISENHFGTPEPPPYARLAIRAFIDFGDRALDECRIEGLDRDEVTGMLAKTLLAVVEAAKDSEA